MTGLLISRAEFGGRVADVRVVGRRVTAIGSLRRSPGEVELDAAGGALLPGLHDHHVHLLSMAAAAESVRCGPPEVTDLGGLAEALRAAPGRWVRGIGYHEAVAGVLDRRLLDQLAGDRPVRVQHRGGALWMLNTRGLAELGVAEAFPDGRLWRADSLLHERLGTKQRPDVVAVGERLSALGITGVTDATPDLPADALRLLTEAELPQRMQLLGVADDGQLPPGATAGPRKILPADHMPPDWDVLHAEISRAHAAGLPVAVHAVTRDSLVVTLAVLGETGTLPGDRIEHASVIGRGTVPVLAKLGVVVVTQPSFVAERGGQYRRDVPESEHADLYRYATLRDAGVSVVPSSDAPFASEDPWRTIRAAVHRDLAVAERVSARTVLDGMLTPLADPGGPPRRVAVGVPADLCLLRVPLREALSDPDSGMVAATICRGDITYAVQG